jgi:diacylglycerol kinase family enzyme
MLAALTFAVVGVGAMMAVWLPLAKSRWASRLRTFTETHGNVLKGEKGNKKDIIFIISPGSGNGRAMDVYDEVLGELRATGRAVDVIVTKSFDDVCSLLTERIDMSLYKTIAVLSGDSMLCELTQATLVKNKGKWPYAPILVLPGGSANCISAENFGEGASIKEIIRHGLTQSRSASVVRLSSSTSETVLYSLHNAFDGIQRYIIEDAVEKHRGDVYPAFGLPGLIGLMLYKIYAGPVVEHPAVFSIMNSDTEAKRNIGCGVTRFDDKMIVLRVDESQGRFNTMGVLMKFVGGGFAKQWREGALPDYIHLEVTDKYTFNAKKGGSIKMFIDGTGTIPIESDSDITFTVIPDAIPYFVRDGLPFEDWDIEFTMVLQDCLSIEHAFSRVASPSKMKDWTTMDFARNCVVTLPDGMEEPLKQGDEYVVTVGPLKGIAKVSLFETSSTRCVFEVSGSMLWGMVHNKFRTTIYQKEGVIYGMTQEKFVKGRPLATGDDHVRKQHETMLRDLNRVFEKEQFICVQSYLD